MKIPDGLMEEPWSALRKERAMRKARLFQRFVTSFAISLVTKIVTEVTIYISLQVRHRFTVLTTNHAPRRRFSGAAENIRTLHLGK
jgi:hypothetical protein